MKKTCAALVFLAIALTSCSSGKSSGYLSGQKQAYLNAKSVARTKVPAGLNSNGFRTRFPVPKQHYSEAAKRVELEAPKV